MEKSSGKISIMIADDQALMLQVLATTLRSVDDFIVIGTAQNGAELMRMLEKSKPDVVLMDVKMPKMNGMEAAKMIDEKMPWVKVIALSMYDHPVYIKEMMKNGARGFLSKNCLLTELCDAIRTVHSGSTYLSREVQETILKDYTNDPTGSPTDEINSLTSREIQIIQLLASGQTTSEIATGLFISNKTVERHKTNILRKLSLRNTHQLINVAAAKGLLINNSY